MSVDNVSSGNAQSSKSDAIDDPSYGRVDVSKVAGDDTTSHIKTIKGLTSLDDIQEYIDKNITEYFKSQEPPNLSAIDRTINELISSVSGDNNELAAIIYHAADVNNSLKIENQDTPDKRKIVLGASSKTISDELFNEIALASQDKASYANNYFSTASTTNSSSNTSTPTTSPENNTTQETSSTPSPTHNFSSETLALLPKGVTLEDLDKTVIIDPKTGKEVDEDDYDLDNTAESAEYKEVLNRSITIQTDGRDEGIADNENAQKIAEALTGYITSPYTNDISEDGLQEILDNLSIEFTSDIFKIVYDDIINNGNPADINKLTNFKNKINDNGLDGSIGEIYNYNYLGGNTGDPSLFLTDIFKNDPSRKLNAVNTGQIATLLSEQLTDHLSNNDDEDYDKKALNFISQSIELLANANPENVSEGKINDLLQLISSKTKGGNPEEIKEILSDLATDAGIETFSAVSIQTGQKLVSNFGEYNYINNAGKSITFSSDEIDGTNFNDFKTDIIALIKGTHDSLNDYKDDVNSQAVIASQTADIIALLSPEQQQNIIDDLSSEPSFTVNKLEHFINFSGDETSNLAELVKKIVLNQNLKEINAVAKLSDGTPDVVAQASIFADILGDFSDINSSVEMQNLIDIITKDDPTSSFLGITKPEQFLNFQKKLKQDLIADGVTDPDNIINNLKNSLGLKNITFQEGDTTYHADTISDVSSEFYLKKLEEGSFNKDDVKQFINHLTEAEKAEPSALITALLADKHFITTEDRIKFLENLEHIITALDEKKDPTLETFKTSLTTGLLTNKPQLESEFTQQEPMPDTYLELLVNNQSNDIEKSSILKSLDLNIITKDTEFTEFSDFKKGKFARLKLEKGLKETNGDIEKILADNNITIHITNNTDELYHLLSEAIVSYVLNDYDAKTDKPNEDRANKLIDIIAKVADKIEDGSNRNVDNDMKVFMTILGTKIHEQDSNADLIDRRTLDNRVSSAEYGIFASKNSAPAEHKENDHNQFLAVLLREAANGKPKINIKDRDEPDKSSEETADDVINKILNA